jgi:hypothetical protein
MVQPGRKSAAASVIKLTSTGSRSRLTAPEFLSSDDRELFVALASDNPHLTRTDAPLLAIYVQAMGRCARLGQRGKVDDWTKAMRAVGMLATKLRLTPQSTSDPQTLGRRRKDAASASYYETMESDDD